MPRKHCGRMLYSHPPMAAITYIFIILVFATLCYFNNDSEHLTNSAIAFGIVMALTGLVHYLMLRHRRNAIEYLGGIIDAITHYDSWTEVQLYTVNVPDGKDSNGHTTYRTETRVRYIHHPDEWWFRTSVGTQHEISQATYNIIAATWNTPMYNFSITGSAISGGERYGDEYYFNDVIRREGGNCNPLYNQTLTRYMFTITEPHTYENKVQNSNSIFRFEKITDDEAQELGLHPYPAINNFDQSPILGKSIDIFTEQLIRAFNAFYGQVCQIRLYVHLFDAPQGIETAEKQQAYWKGGNKNEFSVCLGLDGNTVKWCYTFSWMDEPTLGVMTEDYFRHHPELDLKLFVQWLAANIDNWMRKEFADFRYLRVQLTPAQTALLLAISAALCAGAVYILLETI